MAGCLPARRHGPRLGQGDAAESTATAAVWGGVGRKPDRVRIPFARNPASELNTR
jgi:hypothetical protein